MAPLEAGRFFLTTETLRKARRGCKSTTRMLEPGVRAFTASRRAEVPAGCASGRTADRRRPSVERRRFGPAERTAEQPR